MFIDVVDFNHHPETGLINIATGKIISDSTVNEPGKKDLQEIIKKTLYLEVIIIPYLALS